MYDMGKGIYDKYRFKLEFGVIQMQHSFKFSISFICLKESLRKQFWNLSSFFAILLVPSVVL